jgi:hypothetical protein
MRVKDKPLNKVVVIRISEAHYKALKRLKGDFARMVREMLDRELKTKG